MIKYSLLFSFILIQVTLNAQSLKGNVNALKNKSLVLEIVENKTFKTVDSTVINSSGDFVFKKKLTTKDFYRVRQGPNNAVFIILSPKETVVYVNAEESLASNYTLSGTEEGKIVLTFKKEKAELNKLKDSLIQNIQQAEPSMQQGLQQQAEILYTQKLNGIKQIINGYIQSNQTPLALITITELINPDIDFELFDRLVSKLEKEYSYSAHVEQLVKKRNQIITTAVGQKSPEINLPGVSNKSIALSSLKGKIVLIDFWASWCGPCRKENPNVVRLYNEYKDKGFDIYSVSLDKNKEAWIKAIEMDKLTWASHVSDLLQWSSSVVPQFGIEGIPFTLLIDREGKIIAKGLRGQQLEDKLKELLP